jgi:transposase
MANHLALAQHLTTDELYLHYRASTDTVERAPWHIIWLKSQGKTTPEIQQATGYSGNWIRALIHRYNAQGHQALADKRHGHPGAAPMLDRAQQAQLEDLLDNSKAPDGGCWTGPKIARWIEPQTGREHVHDQRGWDYLTRLGFSAQTPRPRHKEANAAEQAAFKK